MIKRNILFVTLFLILLVIFTSCGHSVKVGKIEFFSKVENIKWKQAFLYDSIMSKPLVDNQGKEWYDLKFNDTLWNYLGEMSVLKSSNWGCDYCDRFFRGKLNISDDDYSENQFYIEYASDDGIWVYANGNLVGHWGGEIRKQGSVNIDAKGKLNTASTMVKIPKEFLISGDNIISVHVSEFTGKELLYFRIKQSAL
jgi:hypothetical protein